MQIMFAYIYFDKKKQQKKEELKRFNPLNFVIVA